VYKMTSAGFSSSYPDLFTIRTHLHPQRRSTSFIGERYIFHKFTPSITTTVFEIYTSIIDKEGIFLVQTSQERELITIGRPIYAFHHT